MFGKVLVLFEDPEVHEKLMTIKLSYSQLTKCPELKENPFRKRICKIFSTDSSGDLTFNDFMLLFSRLNISNSKGTLCPCLFFNFSLCERSPRDIKLHYAFSIYDFDGDNFIGVGDIEQVLLLLHSLFMKRYKIFSSGHKTFDTRAVD